MDDLADDSVDLMVTSPPYPMIEMWDSVFSKQNSAVAEALRCNAGNVAFELMHLELDKVWKEVFRVLKEGGFACINIGDATRTIDETFCLYCNHSRILQSCLQLGFNALPQILWKKQTNAPNKFMGSGMLPAGAYVTLEHEYILILRKGKKRKFNSKEERLRRKQSAFFWEERNLWFSDIWEDLKGAKQNDINKNIRQRSGAYPFELPYRVINMFSLRGDLVLDPFLGTGTTTLAAIVTGRNSVGIEIDENFKQSLFSKFENSVDFANNLLKKRISNHLDYIKHRVKTKSELTYISRVYGFPVLTNHEVEIRFSELEKITVNDKEVLAEYVK